MAKWHWFLNLWIVFLLCGLWHGANWTFLIWGALHGLYYFMTYMLTPPARWLVANTWLSRFPNFCRVVLVMFTFSLICWAWVMFRAENLNQALTIWSNIARIPVEIFQYFAHVLTDGVLLPPLKASGLDWLIRPSGKFSLMPLYVLVLTMIYLLLSNRLKSQGSGKAFGTWNATYRWSAYFFALISILLLGRFGATQFIYFQF